MFKLAKIVKDNPPRGLVAARPARAEPWDFGKAYDANIFDFIGQLGVPLLPMRDLPDHAEGYFLSLHTRSLSDYKVKIQKLAHSRSPILVTSGLASLLNQEFLNRPNVQVIDASVPNPTLYDYRRFTDPYDMAMRLRPIPTEKAWASLADETGWDVSMRYTADPQMAAKVFSRSPGVPESLRGRLTRTVPVTRPDPNFLEPLREQLLKPFGLSLRGPFRVSLAPLGKEFVALHNFNEQPVSMWLRSERGSGFEAAVTLPRTSRTNIQRSQDGFTVEIEAHALTCLRIVR